jgi:Alpha/beta hydrolase domain
VVVVVGGCSGTGGSSPHTTGAPSSTVTTTITALDISSLQLRPVPDGAGVPQASAGVALSPDYAERELLVAGLASTYSGPSTGPATVTRTNTRYVTRLLVRAPTDPSTFSGRVVMEPFNTSGGADAGVVWGQIGSMLEAAGDAWIGVTVRSSSQAHLLAFDPVRYRAIDIAVNDVEWDILRQVGGLVKQRGEEVLLPEATHLYLGGYSQSGIDVATFASAFHDDTRMIDGSPVFDGYLPAAHSGSMAPLQSGPADLPPFEFVPMGAVDAPVIDLETQSDVDGFEAEISPGRTYTSPGSGNLRRPDSDAPGDRYRLYEIAGAPHAPIIPGCEGGGSSFPTASFVRGAYGLLFHWAEDGITPPSVPRLELTTQDVVSVTAVDEVGNAVGGVRSPFVDVPVARYEAHSPSGALCALAGRETPLAPDVLHSRYADFDEYLAQFTDSLDATIDEGHLRKSDRALLIALATSRAEELFASGAD